MIPNIKMSSKVPLTYRRMFKQAVLDVLADFSEFSTYFDSTTFYLLSDPMELSSVIVSKLAVTPDDREKILHFINKDFSAISAFKHSKSPSFIFNYSSAVIKRTIRDKKGLRALVAHEFTHAVLERTGLDDKIVHAVAKAWFSLIPQIEPKLATITSLNPVKFQLDLFSLCLLAIKDFAVNDFIIHKGYAEGLFYYYSKDLDVEIKDVTPGHNSVQEVTDFFKSAVGLLPLWVSFYRQNYVDVADRFLDTVVSAYGNVCTAFPDSINRISEAFVRLKLPPTIKELKKSFDILFSEYFYLINRCVY